MSERQSGPDPIVSSDRLTGSTAPEGEAASNNLVGRPGTEQPRTAFAEPNETAAEETEALSEREALAEGGSFDGVAPLQDLDAP